MSEERDRVDAIADRLRDTLDRVETLETALEERDAEIERLRFRVAELEAELDESDTDYEDLDREGRVRRVRRHLLEKADVAPTDKAEIDYEGVMWAVFDGEPSAGYCYTLMQQAAQADGFDHHTDPKRVTVDADRVNRERVLSHANNGTEGEGSS